MKLREYQEKDSAIICGWIEDEISLHQWSADRIEKFPLDENALNEYYASAAGKQRIIPLTAVDDRDRLAGHLHIRYPNDDQRLVRFGLVILNPKLRGQGNGKEMLRLAIDYAEKVLGASRITLGVFTENSSAKGCYESVGFRPIGKTELYQMPVGEWECTEMELAR